MTTASSETQLLARVRELTGLRDDASARRAVQAVASVLFEQLAAHDRGWLGGFLPGAAAASAAIHRPVAELPEFYARVASREGAEPGYALEHAQSVCIAIAEQLDEGAARHLAKVLPDALVPLFAARERTQAPRHTWHEHTHARSTLSEGRPTSRHPLSEAAPSDAQSESVARRDNPHADTKLSSSTGTTQERERETLAEFGPEQAERK
jgi:uncharacterized protein (DUF2267 family)